jgi:hypothetical protein
LNWELAWKTACGGWKIKWKSITKKWTGLWETGGKNTPEVVSKELFTVFLATDRIDLMCI